MSEVRSLQAFAVVLAAVLIGAGVAVFVLTRGPTQADPRQLTAPERDCGLLDHFRSLGDLKDHLRSAQPRYPWAGDVLLPAQAGDARSGASYSGTNNQVAGVDEADIVKTDGTYIYAATWNYSSGDSEVAIVQAYPPEAASLVARIPVDSWVQGLFLDGDRLAVVTGGGLTYILADASMPIPWFYRAQTSVLVYDVSVPAAPALVRNVTVSGSFVGARLIGDTAYVVAQDYLWLWENDTLLLPTIWVDGVPRDLTYADIAYFRDSWGSSSDVVVLSLNLTSSEPPAFESFLTRGVYQLYMSPTNLYVAGVDWEANAARTVFAETSVVHKVTVDGGEVHYACSARIPGTILNQFSMDEAGGYFRVATTLGEWSTGGRNTSAAVFTLDASLEPAGALTGLAPEERVYAARFLGDRAYLVTFRQVDPLFVIDLRDPRSPRVLGYLKIPGVSDYLHPYGATHLIGVGRNDPDGTGRLHGLKLSLFDVADVEHPAEVATFVVGDGPDESAWSEAQYDHKAFLFVPDRGLVVLPVDYMSWNATAYAYWQGAYAIAITAQGFELRAAIAHSGVDDPDHDWRLQVRRSLYIGDVLYTISAGLVLGTSTESFAEVARVPI